MHMTDPTKLKPKPATHLDLFLDHCLLCHLPRTLKFPMVANKLPLERLAPNTAI